MPTLDSVLAIGFIIAGISYAVAQFFSGRRKGLIEALETQGKELDIAKSQCARLEDELMHKAQELAECKAEAITMRSLLVGGKDLTEDIEEIARQAVKALEKLMLAEHQKTRNLIREIERGGS